MNIITLTSILVSLCALFSYINHQFLKLPNTIGIMLIAVVLSGILIFIPLGDAALDMMTIMVNEIDFSETLLHGMLSFLLFAGALHVNWNTLKKQKYIISILALIGTIFSTVCIAGIIFYIFSFFTIEIPFLYCLLFGSLIAPTDPIAVMSILKKAGVPESLETKVVGESLFNDGIAVVLFIAILAVIEKGNSSFSYISMLFLKEAVGGAILGAVLGYGTYLMLKRVDNYQVEVFLTLALVMGGYELARYLHTSGPIAMVVAGLFIGNLGRSFAMSDKTKQNLDNFWELVDEFLNAVLFLLIGLNLLVIPFDSTAFMIGIIAIPLVLLVRFISVLIPVSILKNFRSFSEGAVPILTWGGLRGGISVALVLSLPQGEIRDIFLLVTYCIIMFSIIVQGLTIGKLVSKYHK